MEKLTNKDYLLLIKLNIIKEACLLEGINIPNNINDLKCLKKYLLFFLGKNHKLEINNFFKTADLEISKIINELKIDCQSDFSKFQNRIKSIAVPIIKGAINALAIKTIITVAPTVELKIGASIFLIMQGTYKLNKNIKYQNILDKNYECQKILRELETTYDSVNKISDTRFDENIIESIKQFLKRNNISYIDTGYLSLRKFLYELDYETKLSFIHFINNLSGRHIEIDKRINQYQYTLMDKIKQLIIKPLTIGGGLGCSLATTINAIDPSISVSIYNGTFLGLITQKLSNNSVISWITGLFGGVLTGFLQFIPTIGEELENIIAKENLIVTGVLGAIVYFSYSIIKNIVEKIKKIIKRQKDNYDTTQLDSILYREDNKKEYQLMEITKTNEKEMVIIPVINQYLKENSFTNIEINSLKQVKSLISSLDKHQKRKIYHLLNTLESIKSSNYSNVLRYIKISGKIAYNTVVTAIGSLAIIDLLKGGTFLDKISTDIFNSPLKQFEAINEVASLEVTNNNTHTPTNNVTASLYTNEIAPTPAPPPAPNYITPTPPQTTPAPTLTKIPLTIEVIKNNSNEYSSVLDNFLNNTDLISELNNKSGADIYSYLYELSEERFISHCTNKIDSKSLIRLVEYIKNNRFNTSDFTFNLIKNSINKRITNYNQYVNLVKERSKITSAILETSEFFIKENQERNKVKIKMLGK